MASSTETGSLRGLIKANIKSTFGTFGQQSSLESPTPPAGVGGNLDITA